MKTRVKGREERYRMKEGSGERERKGKTRRGGSKDKEPVLGEQFRFHAKV